MYITWIDHLSAGSPQNIPDDIAFSKVETIISQEQMRLLCNMIPIIKSYIITIELDDSMIKFYFNNNTVIGFLLF